MPHEHHISALTKDYMLMQDMLFGNKSDFTEILQIFTVDHLFNQLLAYRKIFFRRCNFMQMVQ